MTLYLACAGACALILLSSGAQSQSMQRGCYTEIEAYKRLESIGAEKIFLGLGGQSKTALELWRGIDQYWAVTAHNPPEICIIDFGNRSVFDYEGIPADIAREGAEERQQKKR